MERLSVEAGHAARPRSGDEFVPATTSRSCRSNTGAPVGVEALIRWQHPEAWDPGAVDVSSRSPRRAGL